MLHAYEGERRAAAGRALRGAAAVEVVVRDHGMGIRPHIRSEEEAALGIGLSIIQALAPRVEFKDVEGGGTEVRMEFSTPGTESLAPLARRRLRAAAASPSAGAGHDDGRWRSRRARWRERVLPRVMCVLAARAHFTTDRISDAEMLADALVSRGVRVGRAAAHDAVGAGRPREVELRLGPLGGGGAGKLIANTDAGIGPVVEKLTDERRIASDGRLRDARADACATSAEAARRLSLAAELEAPGTRAKNRR